MRDLILQEFQIQVFLDSGKDYLKLSCCIIPIDWEKSETVANRKLSGVNQCIILAISPKVPENHKNIKILFEKTKIWSLKNVFSLDGKTKLIFCGMTSASSKFPCPYCKTPRSDFKTCERTGEIRLVADLATDFENFESDGAERKSAMN